MVREWFDILSNEIINPDYALFTQSADGYAPLLFSCHHIGEVTTPRAPNKAVCAVCRDHFPAQQQLLGEPRPPELLQVCWSDPGPGSLPPTAGQHLLHPLLLQAHPG